jgi:MscS family membrane protein
MFMKSYRLWKGLVAFWGIWALCLPLSAQDTVAGADTLATVDTTTDATPLSSPSGSGPLYALDYVETGQHRFSLASPYEAVLSHLYFLKETSYHPDSAAMTLNIQNPSGAEAQEKAIQLKQFLDGAGYFIDLDALPHDPDYLDSASHQHRFVLLAAEPDIFLYKKGRGWVYSWTTVQAIDGLHQRIYPFGTLKWLPAWSQRHFLGMHLWQFLGILLFVLFTILLHKLLTRFIGTILRSFLQRVVRRDGAIEFYAKVARPISLLLLFLALNAVFPVLQFSREVNQWVVTAFQVMIPIYAMLIAIQVVNLVMAYFEQRAAATSSNLDDQLVPMIRNLLKGVVVVAALIFVLNRLQVDITAVVGGVAFGTLAFALAAQDTIKNLFGSVVILLDRPFQIGDWVIIGDSEGVVEEVSVRSTRIRTFANSLISIPNGNIASAAINNMGARVYRRFVTRVGLHYTTPPALIELYVEGLREIVRNHPGTRKESFEVHFDTMTDNSLQVLIYVFFAVPDWTQELEGRQSLLLAALELAKRLGISYAFPKQTINIGMPPVVEPGELLGEAGSIELARREMQAYLVEFKQKIVHQKTRTEERIVGSEVDSDAGQGRN